MKPAPDKEIGVRGFPYAKVTNAWRPGEVFKINALHGADGNSGEVGHEHEFCH